ncbi:Cytidine deaminase-like protein [Glarea lozoyensis ATCC 20868]|uniref:Deoxycytidylate deaminase n=1 Tax=Glarea lozoyensis (strain ATCC 20868 / MF5171) TaxID=1116229 RepID=S3EAK0_GLAL2|nr:Cytidine deaminase-like protein [Glarea lozoyensis ATCC 20868]EPE35333.1 Cytidine deaminase-like protein [Glarea lozoyensis ATCC 20868]
MLVGLCGGICSGKRTVAKYLEEHHGFTPLYLSQQGAVDELASATQNGIDKGESDTEDSKVSLRTIPRYDRSSANHSFDNPEDLLDFVTKRWRERWVTTDIHTESILDKLLRRPFFILVSVDAPVSVRWKRCQEQLRKSGSSAENLSLEDFLIKSDEHLYNPEFGLLPLISRATIRLLNTSSNLAHLYATLGKLDLTNEDRLRPSWDQYFMQLASLAAQRSNCMKRRVGCVLVREKRVVSTGYNGTPRGLKNCGEGGCPRCNEGQGSGFGLGTCLCLHAEENALLEAGRERIREGAILYCDTCPCLTCSIKIAQVGISEVVYSQGYSMDGETADVFKQAGVRLRQFIPPANGLIHLEKPSLY